LGRCSVILPVLGCIFCPCGLSADVESMPPTRSMLMVAYSFLSLTLANFHREYRIILDVQIA
jgi:hypothetical protein